MNKRFFILLFLLIFRFVLGYTETLKYSPNREISVTGNIDKTYQNNNKCIIYLGRFILQTENICAVYRNEKIRLIGTIDDQVLVRIFGKISLVDGTIYKLDKYGENSKTCTWWCGFINNFRDFLLNRIRSSVPEPESGLVAGILLGYKNDIGQNFNLKLINSGTIHIAVASGYNVMLVGGMILSLCFWFLKRKSATAVAIAAMVFYALLAGGEPPVVRAIWMAGLIYISQSLGRSSNSLWILILAAWAMLMWDPYLISDVSFQLSVAASVGIIVVEPWFLQKVSQTADERVGLFLSGMGLATSIATMALTSPIIWWHFGRMSWIGILSNTLILPLVPLLMSLSGAMLVFGRLMAIPVYSVAHFMVVVIGFMGG